MMVVETIVLVLFVVLAYAWLGYPAILALVARPRAARGLRESTISRVDVLVAAHNEEGCIEDRLENLIAAVDQLNAGEILRPNASIRIWVGIDGSDDGTARISREFAQKHQTVEVREFAERRGKVAVLKDLVAESAGEEEAGRILVFTDANTGFRPGALDRLLPHFGDPAVGGVCGRLVLIPPSSCSPGVGFSGASVTPEGVYWGLENWLKKKEGEVDSCLGANGAIYAIRRELFRSDLPDNTIVDDFVIGMKVREQGFKLVYDSDAIGVEEVPDQSDEWSRRVRIGAGDYQAMWLCRSCLAPRFGCFAWMFWSHKVLRWFTPQILLVLAGLSAVLACEGGSSAILPVPTVAPLVMAAALVAAGLVGAVTSRLRLPLLKPFVLCDHFLTMQAALLCGFVRFCRGGLQGVWTRTPRGSA